MRNSAASAAPSCAPRTSSHGDGAKQRSRFTPDELSTMTKAFARGGFDAACAVLPYRRRGSVYKRLERMGLAVGVRRRPWTLDERRTLRDRWATTPAKNLAADFGRTEYAVTVMAHKLRLARKRNRLWTDGAVRIIERAADQLVAHLAERTGRSEGSVRHQIMAAIVSHAKRRRAEMITDLGGMVPNAGAKHDGARQRVVSHHSSSKTEAA